MDRKHPKPQAILWWRRGLEDGKHCAKRRRARFFEEYRESAEESLKPGELLGPFSVVYARAFRYGYDNEQLRRELENTYYAKPKKRVTIA